MCKIIAIANQKGGVGKTTTTSNLGIGLAKQGKKVLLIDADAQGSLTASLGFTEPDSLEVTLATIMGNLINDEEVEPGEGILHHEEGIDLMPGNIELSGLEVSLVNVMSRETVLRSYIEIVRESYDYILIDCMPSLGMITINAFASADSILIPVQAAYLPVKGLQQLIKTVGKVKRQINPKLEIEGILLTMVDSRTNYAKDISSMLKEAYGSRVRIFTNVIPISVRAAEISAEGISIYKHDPKGKVASAYKMKYEAMKHQGKKSGKNTLDEVGEAAGENAKKVQRYIWLSRLSDELLVMVDNKKLGFSQGVDISFLAEEAQQWVQEVIEEKGCNVSMVQSAKIKEYGKTGELTLAMVRLILTEEKPKERKVTLKADKISEYFAEDCTSEEIEGIIIQLLDEWKKKQ